MLGLYQQRTLVFEEGNETSAFIDFALSEKLYSGKSKIEQMLEDEVKDQKLAKILTAYDQSYASLFEVRTPHPDDYKIDFVDLLNGDAVQITDIRFSRSVVTGTLLFFRVVSFADFAMTSGAVFAFAAEDKEIIMRRYNKHLAKSSFSINSSITRFIAFFRLFSCNHPVGSKNSSDSANIVVSR